MNNVENKIVQMKFDNEQFESAVATTLGTLDKLKEKLRFDDAGKGLENLGKASGNYNYTLNDIGQSLDQLNGRFSTMGNIGRRVLENLTDKAMEFATKGIGGMFSGVTSGGLSRAMNLEQARFQMQGIFKDAEKVRSVIYDDILPELQGTPYSLDQAAVVIGQLGASGIQASEDVRQATRAIAGLAAMSGRGFDEVGRIFSKVAGQGNMMGGELQQLSTYGINAAANLAEYFNKVASGEEQASDAVKQHVQEIIDAYGDLSEGTIRDAASKRMIYYEDLAAAMDNLYGAHAKKSTEMYTGALEDLKAALARIGAEPAAVGLEVLRDAFNALVPAVDAVNAVLKPFTNATKGVVENAEGEKAFGGQMTGSLAKEVQSLGHSFANLFVQMDENGKITRWTAESADEYRQSLEDMEASGQKVLKWQKDYANYASDGDAIMNPQMWRIITASTKSFTNGLKALRSVLQPIAKGILKAFPKVSLKSIAAFAEGIERFTNGLILSKKNAERLRWITQGLFTPLGVGVKIAIAVIKGLVLTFKELYKTIKPALNAVMAFLGGIGRSVSGFGDMASQITDLVFSIGKFGISLLVSIAKFLQLDKIIKLIQKGLNVLANIFDKVGQYLGKFFSEFTGNTSKVAKTVAEFLHLKEAFDLLKRAATSLKDGFVKILHLDELNAYLITLRDTISNFFKDNDFFALLGDNFRNFIEWVKELAPLDKIISGVSSAFDGLVNAASRLTSGPASKVKSLLKTVGSHIVDFFTNLKEGEAITRFFRDSLPKSIDNLLSNLGYFKKIVPGLVKSLGQLLLKLFGFKTVGDMLSAAAEKIKKAVAVIKEFFGFISDVGKTKTAEQLDKISDSLDKTFNGDAAKKMGEFGSGVKSLREGLGDKFSNIGETLKLIFGSLDPSVGKRAIRTLGLFVIAFTYLKTMRKLSIALKNWGEVGLNLGTWISNITSGFGLKQVNTAISKAIRLISLAASLLLFAGAVKMLADLNWKQILIGSAVMLAALGTFYLILRAFDRLDKKAEDSTKIAKLALAMTAIAAGLWLLAQAIVAISSIPWKQLLIGAAVISAVMGAFYLLAKGVATLDMGEGGAKALGKASFALIGIAKGMEMMAIAIKAIGELDPIVLTKGLTSVLAIMALFALFASSVKANAKVFSASVGMIAIAGAILLIYKAISLMTEIVDAKNFGKALNVITGVFVALSLFAMIASRSEGGIFTAAVGMMAFANAILIISVAMVIIGKAMDASAFDQAIEGLIVIFGGFAAFAKFAGADTAKAGLSMLALAAGVIILVDALNLLAAMDPGVFASGLIKMGIAILGLSFALVFLATAGKAMDGKSVTNIILMSAALLMLGAALYLVAAIPLAALIVSILGLAAALVVVGAVLMLFSSISVGLIVVAAAFALLGVACVMVGAGIMLFVMALSALIPLLLALAAVPLDTLGAGIEVLKIAAAGIAEALKIAAVGILAFGAACLVGGLGVAVLAIGVAALGIAMLVASLSVLAMAGALAVFALVVQNFFGGGMLEVIGNGFTSITESFKNGITGLFASFLGFGDKAKEDTAATFDAIGEGATEGAERNKPVVENAMQTGLINVLQQKGLIAEDGMYGIGGDIMNSGALGITDNQTLMTDAIGDATTIDPSAFDSADLSAYLGGQDVGLNFAEGVSSGKKDASDAGAALGASASRGAKGSGSMQTAGTASGALFVGGVNKSQGSALKAGSSLDSNARRGAAQHQKTWGTLGGNAGEGYAKGIRDKIDSVAKAAANLVKKAIAAAKEAQNSNSPSKEFAKLGTWGGEGYANGFLATSKLVSHAVKSVVTDGMDSVSDAIGSISDLFGNDFDFDPTITPVVDLTKVDQSVDQMGSMFASSFGINTPFGSMNAAFTASSFNESRNQNARLDAMNKLANKIDTMTDTMNSRSLNNYINIDGSTDPEAFADGLIRSFRLNARTV